MPLMLAKGRVALSMWGICCLILLAGLPPAPALAETDSPLIKLLPPAGELKGWRQNRVYTKKSGIVLKKTSDAWTYSHYLKPLRRLTADYLPQKPQPGGAYELTIGLSEYSDSLILRNFIYSADTSFKYLGRKRKLKIRRSRVKVLNLPGLICSYKHPKHGHVSVILLLRRTRVACLGLFSKDQPPKHYVERLGRVLAQSLYRTPITVDDPFLRLLHDNPQTSWRRGSLKLDQRPGFGGIQPLKGAAAQYLWKDPRNRKPLLNSLSIGVYRLNDAKESLAYLRAASKQPGYSKVERMTPPTVLKPGFRLIKPRAWTYLVQSGRYVVEVKAAFDKERPSRKQRYEVGRSAARMKEWVGQRAREVETAAVQLAKLPPEKPPTLPQPTPEAGQPPETAKDKPKSKLALEYLLPGKGELKGWQRMKTAKGPVPMQFGGKRPVQRIQGIYQAGGGESAISIMRFASSLEAAVFTMVGYSWWEKEFEKQGFTIRKERFKAQPAISCNGGRNRAKLIISYGSYVAMIESQPPGGAKKARAEKAASLVLHKLKTHAPKELTAEIGRFKDDILGWDMCDVWVYQGGGVYHPVRYSSEGKTVYHGWIDHGRNPQADARLCGRLLAGLIFLRETRPKELEARAAWFGKRVKNYQQGEHRFRAISNYADAVNLANEIFSMVTGGLAWDLGSLDSVESMSRSMMRLYQAYGGARELPSNKSLRELVRLYRINLFRRLESGFRSHKKQLAGCYEIAGSIIKAHDLNRALTMETNFLRRMQMRVELNRLDAKLKGAMTSLGFSLLSYLEDMGGVAENSLEFGLMNQTAAMCNHMISQLLQKAAKSAPLGVDDLAWLQLLKIQAIELRGQLLEKYLKEYRLRKKRVSGAFWHLVLTKGKGIDVESQGDLALLTNRQLLEDAKRLYRLQMIAYGVQAKAFRLWGQSR
jgi:hypothetical protein